MLSETEFGESLLGKIVSVRSEAPAEVDDVVVSYSSQRKEYIQAKLRVSPGDSAWNVMWQHFLKQYQLPDFKRGDQGDLITLAVQWTTETTDLENLLTRSSTSESYAIWKGRLTQPQIKLVQRIIDTLNIDEEEMLNLCKQVKVWRLSYEFDPLKSDSFENEVRRIVQGVVFPAESVFSVLLGLVATTASLRKDLKYEDVVGYLNQRSIQVKKIASGRISPNAGEQARLRQRLEGLKTQYDLLVERTNRVRLALAIETDPERRFAAEKRLEILEVELSKLSDEMAKLEHTGLQTS